jgi:hypothetical protein
VNRTLQCLDCHTFEFCDALQASQKHRQAAKSRQADRYQVFGDPSISLSARIKTIPMDVPAQI